MTIWLPGEAQPPGEHDTWTLPCKKGDELSATLQKTSSSLRRKVSRETVAEAPIQLGRQPEPLRRHAPVVLTAT
jgi:hypothetical protein